MSHDRESSLLGTLRKAVMPITLGSVVAFTSIGSAPPQEFQPWPKDRPSPQLQGIFDYGHREPKQIQESGDIGKGTEPLDGVALGEADIPLIYDDISEWTKDRIEFGIESWNIKGDTRDKYINFVLNEVMNRPDNPNPNFKWSLIYEKESYRDLSEKEVETDLDYLTQYFNHPSFLKDSKGRPVLVVFAQDLEGLVNNRDYIPMWTRQAEKRGIHVILQEYPFMNLDPKIDYVSSFNYGFPFYDLLPSGFSKGKDTARVTFGYSKPGDIKFVPRNSNRLRQNIRKMLYSEAEFGFTGEDDEYVEQRQLDPMVSGILQQELP